MSNWGGIKEHMTKKPRRVFSNKKLYHKGENDKKKRSTYKLNEDKIRINQQKRLVNELIWHFVIFAFITCITILFTKG